MALTIENAGALVPGVMKGKEANVALQRVKVLRTFVGLPPDAKVGSIIEISKALAVQAKDAHKVEFLAEEVKPEPLKVETKKEEFISKADESLPGAEDPVGIVKKSKKA